MTTPKTADQLDARIITYQIDWRLSAEHMKELSGAYLAGAWTALEGECYGRADWAEVRRKYWENTSLATVLDFRVSEREEVLK